MELDRSLLSWGSQPEPDSWSTGGSPHSVYCAVCPSAVCKSKPTGPLPGCVSQARGPPRACVWSSESELWGGKAGWRWAPCLPAGGRSVGFLVTPSLRGWRPRPPSASTAWP